VDWVVICERCLRAGVALLPEEHDRADTLEQQVADLEEQLRQTQAYADRLEDAFQHKPKPAPKQTKPKPAQRRNRYEKDEEA
jgi:uncharacterized protein YecA (UPF0149 family)